MSDETLTFGERRRIAREARYAVAQNCDGQWQDVATYRMRVEVLKRRLATETARADRAEERLAAAAMEINVAGPVDHRIRVMRAEYAAEVDALRAENAKLRAWLTAANSHHREMSDK